MSHSNTSALAISRGVLRVLIVLNVIAGLFVLGLLFATYVAEDFVVEALARNPVSGEAVSVTAMRLIMVIGVASFPLAHILFSRLLAIVDTVRLGDAFTMRNAGRLRACAWAVLGLEGMHVLVGIVAAALPFDLNWEFSPIGLLAVLLLFVLAQVFTEGARMRDDLEGTV